MKQDLPASSVLGRVKRVQDSYEAPYTQAVVVVVVVLSDQRADSKEHMRNRNACWCVASFVRSHRKAPQPLGRLEGDALSHSAGCNGQLWDRAQQCTAAERSGREELVCASDRTIHIRVLVLHVAVTAKEPNSEQDL